jgi:hypothetical protein
LFDRLSEATACPAVTLTWTFWDVVASHADVACASEPTTRSGMINRRMLFYLTPVPNWDA